MATIDVRDVAGTSVGTRDLPDELFAAPVNVPLMHQVVVAGAAAQRSGTHSTKTRGDVRGGGVKPWRQKGTGRARQGSIRAPHWAGGGVAHGPQPHGHELRVNRKMKKGALRSALSDALASGKVAVVDTLAFESPRTKAAVKVLATLGLHGNVLIVLSRPNEATERSFRNLTNVRIDFAGNLTTYDVLYADHVLFTQAALGVLTGEEPEAVESPVAVEIDEKAKPERTSAPVTRRRRKAPAEPEAEAASAEQDAASDQAEAEDDERDAAGTASAEPDEGQHDEEDERP